MSVDWKDLNGKTSGFRTLTHSTDPQGVVLDAVYSGLQVNLSEVVAKFAPGQSPGIAIFADTLVVDVPKLSARGMSVLARNIDVSKLSKQTLELPVPGSGGFRILEVLAGGATGGPLRLIPSSSQTTPYVVPLGLDPLQAVFYNLGSDGKAMTTVETSTGYLADLIARPLALNSLQASFTSASWLMQSSDPNDATVAASMLNWIVACVRALGSGGAAIPENFAELYGQAAALLVTLNVSPGALYVPVLSSAFYKQRGTELLNVLQSYQDNLDTLNGQTEIKKLIQDVSGTFQGTTQDEVEPLQTELDQISSNLDSLVSEIQALGGQYAIQSIESKTRFILLQHAIAQERVKAWLNACLQLTLGVLDISVSIGKTFATLKGFSPKTLEEAVKGLSTALGDALKGLTTYTGIPNTISTGIDAVTGAPSSPALNDRAAQLIEMQGALMTSYQAGIILWDASKKDDGTAPGLPASLAAVRVDPSLAWDNYMVEVEAAVNNISGAASAANNYLASLKILAQYGKAIDAKMIVYSSQLARGAVVKAQIRAAQKTQARWEQLAATAQTDQERLAALKGMIQSRSNSVRRSLYIAWTQYRDSYRYLYFAPPPVSLNMGMSVSDLRAAFAKVSNWVAQLLGDDPSGTRIQLPADNVPISYRFKIVNKGDELGGGDSALLEAAASASEGPSLSWTIPFADSQQEGVLPRQGKVAIWIKEAKFFLEGVKGNQRGNVIVKVSTSGSYQNGFTEAHTFVTKSMAGDYGYRVADMTTYIPWKIDTGIYQTPTPFTQWTMVFEPDGGNPSKATALRMELTVAYRSA